MALGQSDLKSILVARLLAAWVSLCILAGLFGTTLADPHRSSNLVYCPLSKQWVEKHSTVELPKSDLLAGYCAPAKSKERFYRSLSRVSIASNAELSIAQSERIFSDYIVRGDEVLFRLNFPGSRPEREQIVVAEGQATLISSQQTLAIARDGSVALPFRAESTFCVNANFQIPECLCPNRHSETINTRGPPSNI